MRNSILHINGRDEAAGCYTNLRLQNGRDDRDTDAKRSLDAELRGKLGVDKANKLIAAIDRYKSQR